MEYITLSNGIKMPVLGYGVYQVTKDECERCVLDALKAGYRSIDTAQSYFNEEEVGSAIKKSGVPREEIFLTSKVWIENYGYDACKKSVEESLKKLKTDYLDLILLHQPFADYYGAWRALEDLYKEGRLKAIGISNFYPDRMVDIASFAEFVLWSIKLRFILLINKLLQKNIWTNMVFRLKLGHHSAKAEEVFSTIRF